MTEHAFDSGAFDNAAFDTGGHQGSGWPILAEDTKAAVSNDRTNIEAE